MQNPFRRRQRKLTIARKGAPPMIRLERRQLDADGIRKTLEGLARKSEVRGR